MHYERKLNAMARKHGKPFDETMQPRDARVPSRSGRSTAWLLAGWTLVMMAVVLALVTGLFSGWEMQLFACVMVVMLGHLAWKCGMKASRS